MVPISNTLNTNMDALVEEMVKELLGKKKLVKYTVNVHWGCPAFGAAFVNATDHPKWMRATNGLAGVDLGGSLLWGNSSRRPCSRGRFTR
jgi:hypothetical protein